jgi:pilus assembly protein Flp/PilA
VESNVALYVGFPFVDPKEKRTMTNLGRCVVEFLKREDGPTAVEYAMMLALLIVVCIAGIVTLGSNANTTFSTVGSAVAATGS